MSNPTPSNMPPYPGQAAPMDYQGSPQIDRDAEHLRILSICWYVGSGLALVMGCFPIIHVSMGLLLILNPDKFGGGGGSPPPPFIGWIFFLVGSAIMLTAWTGAILGFITARSLPQRRRKTLCYVAAALACLQMPIGTVLGVFTFVVLARPSIKASFS